MKCMESFRVRQAECGFVRQEDVLILLGKKVS